MPSNKKYPEHKKVKFTMFDIKPINFNRSRKIQLIMRSKINQLKLTQIIQMIELVTRTLKQLL